MSVFKVIKDVSISGPLEPDAIYFIKPEGSELFELYTTTTNGVPVSLQATVKTLKADFANATVVEFHHNLNRRPKVLIIIDNEEHYSTVLYPDANRVIVKFKKPKTGTIEIF